MTMLTRLRALLQRPRVSRELDDELAFHVEMETQANMRRGMSPADARRAALRDFGGVVQTKESVRDVRHLSIESIWQDVRYAVRTLGAHRGFTFAAAGMLALGIGITTAMFTVADSLLIRPVPFRAPEQLASISMGVPGGGLNAVRPAVLHAWRDSPAFAGAESAIPATAILEADGAIVTRGIATVTPGIFELLGNVRPVRGRLFDANEGHAGNNDRILVSEDVWRTLYGGDPEIVGRRIRIDGEALTVVGVLPSDFRFPAWNTVLWRPIRYDVVAAPEGNERLQAYVRFAEQIPREEALRLATEAARHADRRNAKLEPQLRPLVGRTRDLYSERAIPLLAGGVILVFLVLCANVCSLLLARLTTRRREFSMRAALGASRARLMRQAFMESAVLGALGVVAGMSIGWLLVACARGFLPESFLLATLNPLDIDVRTLGATSVAGVLATIAAGLLPAWLGTRVNAGESLRVVEQGGTEARGARILMQGLLITEVALACTLLVGATLLVRSFVNLQLMDRGLDASGVIVASVHFRLQGSTTPEVKAEVAAMRSVIENAVGGLPHIRQITWSVGAPPQGGLLLSGAWIPDVPGASAIEMVVEERWVDPAFFTLYGIPLLRGQAFGSASSSQDVIVGERVAAALWPGADPIGRTFKHDSQQYRVIGLARETRYPSIETDRDRPELYQSFAEVASSFATLNIRCVESCDTALVHQRIAAAHPNVRLRDVRPLDQLYLEQLARPRAAAALAFAFAAIAVLAAAGGLFSVLSYAVGRRRREFGIRTALGASPAQIRRVVFRDGLVVALIGIAVGALAAAPLARILASMQFGVTASDPVSLGIVLVVLAATTLAASWRPARAAARVDPLALLREE